MFLVRFFLLLDSLSALVRREIKSVTFHDAIMTFLLFQLRGFVIIHHFRRSTGQ